VEQIALLEIHEQQGGARVRDEIAERIEVAVAAVVGNRQRPIFHPDEAPRTTAVRDVDTAVQLDGACSARDEQGIRRGDGHASVGIEPREWFRRAGRACSRPDVAQVDVPRAVAEALADIEHEHTGLGGGDRAVRPVSAARREIDA